MRASAWRIRRAARASVAGIVGGIVVAGAAACGARSTPTAGAPRPTPPAAADADSVAVGYGTRARRDLTGAVGSVDGRTGERDGAQRVEEMLRRVPGVVVSRLSGGSYSVRVRNGGATFTSGGSAGEPLFVLDGVPLPVGVGALNGVSPQDVARIDVLKDAEAAVYGSQAANGVILVRTRRGRP
jgi:TonB-dependent SusC/RagA subfamily outer membrane receptor